MLTMLTPLAHVTLLDLGVVVLAFALGGLAGFTFALRRAGGGPASIGAGRGEDAPDRARG